MKPVPFSLRTNQDRSQKAGYALSVSYKGIAFLVGRSASRVRQTLGKILQTKQKSIKGLNRCNI